MKTNDFDFYLPKALIAQTPLEDRSSSRMLVVDKAEKTYRDYHFSDILDFLRTDDIIVRNNTRVIPARLFGIKKATDNNTQKDGHCEVLLLKIWKQYLETLVSMPKLLNSIRLSV